MHPGQSRRLRHEQAQKTGTYEVHRHGRKVATCALGEPQGTAEVRPWIVTMIDGTVLDRRPFRIEEAEAAAIVQAVRIEQGRA